MKQFLTKMLSELEARTGIRQLYFLQQKPDAVSQVNILIDSMVRVCGEYDYIPELNQKAIIQKEMERDQNYDGLNARVIRKWFDLHKDLYWNRDKPTEPTELPPVSPETQKLINEYIVRLSQGPKQIPAVSRYEVHKANERPKESALPYRPSTSAEYILEVDLKAQYGRECFDLVTGEKNSNWMPFEEWKKLQ